MQDPGKPTHFTVNTALVLHLLKPIIHNPRLPRVINRIRSSNSSMKQPLLVGQRRLSVSGHLNNRVKGKNPL
ncbi:hypothetical protein Hanom_Chr13g01238071 [Helianthus anomalus]